MGKSTAASVWLLTICAILVICTRRSLYRRRLGIFPIGKFLSYLLLLCATYLAKMWSFGIFQNGVRLEQANKKGPLNSNRVTRASGDAPRK